MPIGLSGADEDVIGGRGRPAVNRVARRVSGGPLANDLLDFRQRRLSCGLPFREGCIGTVRAAGGIRRAIAARRARRVDVARLH